MRVPPNLPPAAPPARKRPHDNENYQLVGERVVSKHFPANLERAQDCRVFVPPLLEAYTLDDIQFGTVPVNREEQTMYFGLEANYYFPEYKLYVINNDNFTFYAIAEAVARGDLKPPVTILTGDAHDDLAPPHIRPRAHKRATLAEYARYTAELSMLSQLQAAQMAGLVTPQGIHLIQPPREMPAEFNGQPLFYPLDQAKRLGTVYIYPNLPQQLLDGLHKRKLVAHVDIDFHTESFGAQCMEMLSGRGLDQLMELARGESFRRPSPEEIGQFADWVKRTGYFRNAGLRIICVSPGFVHPDDIIWLTGAHVQMVMDSA